MIRGRLVVSLVALGSVGGCAAPGDAARDSSTDAVPENGSAPSDARPSGETRGPGELQSAWWSWAAGAPTGTNPVEDATGAHCRIGQPSSGIWFLAGTFGGSVKRRCTVPRGRALVVPAVNSTGSEGDCAAFMEGAAGSVKLDGKQVGLERWPAVPITMKGVADNPVTLTEGTIETYGCGVWALIPSMPPGTHTVSIRGSSGDFRVSADYGLTVE
ncbi:signal protein [Actinomadura algeriensis]|uniref:Ig-like domain-containing protein n=1 Tax=Actinomadura algeriensis TaxID=1679523 RepID=A0ABR9K4S2_9ACTN|nr:signal protein [Actinomadura algeriensis]MBE1537703.1 hypothetical protein [Actinomadura algeriensis]